MSFSTLYFGESQHCNCFRIHKLFSVVTVLFWISKQPLCFSCLLYIMLWQCACSFLFQICGWALTTQRLLLRCNYPSWILSPAVRMIVGTFLILSGQAIKELEKDILHFFSFQGNFAGKAILNVTLWGCRNARGCPQKTLLSITTWPQRTSPLCRIMSLGTLP